MCDPCCLVVGCNPRSRTVDRPNGYDQLPEKIICPHCSQISRPLYKKDDYIFSLCFVPLWPCGSSSPYTACQNCYEGIGMVRGNPCRSCHVSHTFDCEYCPNCGTKISGGESRTLSVH